MAVNPNQYNPNQYNPNQQMIGPYKPPSMPRGAAPLGSTTGGMGGLTRGPQQGGYTPAPMPGGWNPQVPQAGGYGGTPNAGYTPFPGNPMPTPQMPPNFNQAGGSPQAARPNPFGGNAGGASQYGPMDWVERLQLGGLTPETFGDKNSAMARYLENILPPAQFAQNAYQWGQEFGEGNRRWNDQFGWQRQGDTFNMGLAGRQQQMAEWQARENANQWAAQFGREGVRDEREWDLSNRQFGLSQELGRGDLGVKQQANTIDQMWKSGQLTNQQRELALAELTQSQKYGLDTQRLGLDTRTQDELTKYRNAQLAQEAAIAREQMANQQQIATMQAYGRSQSPNVRWARSWG